MYRVNIQSEAVFVKLLMDKTSICCKTEDFKIVGNRPTLP